MSQHKILVVDDEEAIRYSLERMLRKEGFDISTAADGEEALAVFEKVKPDLVLLDIMMPKLNGYEVCERLKGTPDTRLTPVVMVTSSSAVENRVRGIEAGADDFLGKPFERNELIARVRSLLRIKRYTDELERAENVLMALAQAIESRDPWTVGHCERLVFNAERLGRCVGCSEEDVTSLRRGGILHDIGKVAVPDSVLLKAGPLDDEQRAIMNRHPIIGEEICSGLRSFRPVLPIIRHHHERWDGSGYPDGLKGEEIPRAARILQIVDVYDALTTKRPYKSAFSMETALDIMREEVAKGWWDPDIFREFEQLVLDEGFFGPAPSEQAQPEPAAAAVTSK